jgi:hypothetical protein
MNSTPENGSSPTAQDSSEDSPPSSLSQRAKYQKKKFASLASRINRSIKKIPDKVIYFILGPAPSERPDPRKVAFERRIRRKLDYARTAWGPAVEDSEGMRQWFDKVAPSILTPSAEKSIKLVVRQYTVRVAVTQNNARSRTLEIIGAIFFFALIFFSPLAIALTVPVYTTLSGWEIFAATIWHFTLAMLTGNMLEIRPYNPYPMRFAIFMSAWTAMVAYIFTVPFIENFSLIFQVGVLATIAIWALALASVPVTFACYLWINMPIRLRYAWQLPSSSIITYHLWLLLARFSDASSTCLQSSTKKSLLKSISNSQSELHRLAQRTPSFTVVRRLDRSTTTHRYESAATYVRSLAQRVCDVRDRQEFGELQREFKGILMAVSQGDFTLLPEPVPVPIRVRIGPLVRRLGPVLILVALGVAVPKIPWDFANAETSATLQTIIFAAAVFSLVAVDSNSREHILQVLRGNPKV